MKIVCQAVPESEIDYPMLETPASVVEAMSMRCGLTMASKQ